MDLSICMCWNSVHFSKGGKNADRTRSSAVEGTYKTWTVALRALVHYICRLWTILIDILYVCIKNWFQHWDKRSKTQEGKCVTRNAKTFHSTLLDESAKHTQTTCASQIKWTVASYKAQFWNETDSDCLILYLRDNPTMLQTFWVDRELGAKK